VELRQGNQVGGNLNFLNFCADVFYGWLLIQTVYNVTLSNAPVVVFLLFIKLGKSLNMNSDPMKKN